MEVDSPAMYVICYIVDHAFQRMRPLVTMPNGARLIACEGQPLGEEGDAMSVDVQSHQTPKYRWAYLDERNESGRATLRPFPSSILTTTHNGPVASDGRLWTVLPEPEDRYV